MSEHIIDTSVVPKSWNVKEFAIDKVTRCEDCMFHDDGWCHVWEAETIPDGWCYQGAESDEDYCVRIEEVLNVRAVA